MTNTPDTSPEAVERIAQHYDADIEGCDPECAATLRALSAALDVERASHTATITDWQADLARAEAAEAERDALKAENVRLRRAADVSATIANGALDPTAREAALRRDLCRVRDELRAALRALEQG